MKKSDSATVSRDERLGLSTAVPAYTTAFLLCRQSRISNVKHTTSSTQRNQNPRPAVRQRKVCGAISHTHSLLQVQLTTGTNFSIQERISISSSWTDDAKDAKV